MSSVLERPTDRTTETATPNPRRKHPLPAIAPWPELRDVKWTGNVKPVDADTEAEVLDEFVLDSRVTLNGPPTVGPNHADRSRKFRIRRYEVRDLNEKTMEVLLLFAKGVRPREVARQLNSHPLTITRVIEWLAEFHGIQRLDIRALAQRTPWAELPDAIRALACEAREPAVA